MSSRPAPCRGSSPRSQLPEGLTAQKHGKGPSWGRGWAPAWHHPCCFPPHTHFSLSLLFLQLYQGWKPERPQAPREGRPWAPPPARPRQQPWAGGQLTGPGVVRAPRAIGSSRQLNAWGICSNALGLGWGTQLALGGAKATSFTAGLPEGQGQACRQLLPAGAWGGEGRTWLFGPSSSSCPGAPVYPPPPALPFCHVPRG